MKKISQMLIVILLGLISLFGFAACKSDDAYTPPANLPEETPDESEISKDANILIVYFSWSSSARTEQIANYISSQTGGTIYEIHPLIPYPTTSYMEWGYQARDERDNNARPEIKDPLSSIDEYDVIFVGYPIWWHTAPMIIGTFLESYDFEGKDIYPFSQSDSMNVEQFNNSMDFVRGCAVGANVHDGMFVRASNTLGIEDYLRINGFIV